MKKLVLSVFSFMVLAVSGITLFTPSLAAAANNPSGKGDVHLTFVNMDTLTDPKYGTFAATKAKPAVNDEDPSMTWSRKSDPDSCTDTITSTPGKSMSYTYHLSTPHSAANTNCDNKTFSLNKPASSGSGNQSIYMSWVDKNDIQPGAWLAGYLVVWNSFSGGTDKVATNAFVYNTAGKIYIQDNGTKCNSYIDGISSDHTTGKLHVQVPKVDGIASDFLHDMGLVDNGQGCYVVGSGFYGLSDTGYNGPDFNHGLTVKLGTPANATKDGGAPKDPNAGSSTPQSDPCADAGKSYAWILCPGVNAAQDFISGAYDKFITPLLQVDPLSGNDALEATTKVFVNLANVLLVIVFLVMIFGTAFNMSPYTTKRVLPRVVIAAIALNFSFFLCGIVVDIGNIFGDGIQGLVQTALSSVHTASGASYDASSGVIKNIIAGTSGIVALTALGAAAVLLGPAVLLLILGFVLAILTFILTLILRKLLIDILILLAPLAILAWVLPNTESLFNKWKGFFLKTVMVYPVISLIISAGFIVQRASASATSGVNQIIGILAPMIAFFMAPMGLKWGGSLLTAAGRVGSKVTGLNAGRSAAMGAGMKPVSNLKSNIGKNMSAIGTARRNANLNAGGLRGFSARLQAGVPTGAGATSGRRQAAQDLRKQQLASAKSAQISSLGSSLEGLTDDEIMSRAKTGTPEMQQAAVMAMAKRGNTSKLSELKTSMSSDTYSEAMRRADSSKVREKAPHLVPGGGYSSMNAEKMTKLDAEGAKGYMDHLQEQKGKMAAHPAGTKEHDEAKAELQNFVDNVQRVSSDKKLSNGANTGGAKVLLAGTTSAGTSVHDTATQAYVSSKITTTGQYV